jgi:hypothetical protein
MMIAVIGGKAKGDKDKDEPISRIGGYDRGRYEERDEDEGETHVSREEACVEACRAAIRAFKLGDAKALHEALSARDEALGR